MFHKALLCVSFIVNQPRIAIFILSSILGCRYLLTCTPIIYYYSPVQVTQLQIFILYITQYKQPSNLFTHLHYQLIKFTIIIQYVPDFANLFMYLTHLIKLKCYLRFNFMKQGQVSRQAAATIGVNISSYSRNKTSILLRFKGTTKGYLLSEAFATFVL